MVLTEKGLGWGTAGTGVKNLGSSFYGLKQWWAPSLPALTEVTSYAPSSGRHKHAACTAKTHGNYPSATAAASPGICKPLLSSESLSKKEDSAEYSKFKCVTFCSRLHCVWRYCPTSKSLVQRPDDPRGIGGRRFIPLSHMENNR